LTATHEPSSLPDVAAKKKQADQSAEQQAAAELVRQARERGLLTRCCNQPGRLGVYIWSGRAPGSDTAGPSTGEVEWRRPMKTLVVAALGLGSVTVGAAIAAAAPTVRDDL
jgi:hypothetical protein